VTIFHPVTSLDLTFVVLLITSILKALAAFGEITKASTLKIWHTPEWEIMVIIIDKKFVYWSFVDFRRYYCGDCVVFEGFVKDIIR
jgi:hypothetical protein